MSAITSALPQGTGGGTGSSCDRKCLQTFLTVYTDAYATRNVSYITKVSPNVRVTDNGVVSSLGKGFIWQTIGPRRLTLRASWVDAVSGAATFRGLVTNTTVSFSSNSTATPVEGPYYVWILRLRIAGGLITEVEEISSVANSGPFNINWAAANAPNPIWDAYVPQAKQESRDNLAAIAHKYYDVFNNKLRWQDAPFHPECVRIENSFQTTDSVGVAYGCGAEKVEEALLVNAVLNNTRLYISDPERGTVAFIARYALPAFGSTIIALAAFKIDDGLIRHNEVWFSSGQEYSNWPDNYP